MRNLLFYVLIALVNMALIAFGYALVAGTLPGFRAGEPFAPAGPALASLLAILLPILSGWLAANRPRLGSENLADDVNKLQKAGVPKDEMAVVPKADLELIQEQVDRLRRIKPLQDAHATARALRSADAARD